MSAISGILSSNHNVHSIGEILSSMSILLSHRGTNKEIVINNGEIGFSINRYDFESLRPYCQLQTDEINNIFIVCSGTIFNYEELCKNILCEKENGLVSLFLKYGIDFIKKLNGQFTIAIYDTIDKSLLLIRDHFGISPVYYYLGNDFFVFSSEIKSILEYPGIRREVSLIGLDQLFTFPSSISPHTMFKGVFSIPAGHYIKFKNNNISVNDYWDVNYPTSDYKYNNYSVNQYLESVEDNLIRSVKLRIGNTDDIDLYLSGGLDSSLISSIAAKSRLDKSFRSFSLHFSKEDKGFYYQKLMQRELKLDHYNLDFSINWEAFYDQLKYLIWHTESPQKDTAGIFRVALSAFVKEKNGSIVLSGDGADEIFGGHIGYSLDEVRANKKDDYNLESLLEKQTQYKVWGDKNFFYEKNFNSFTEIKKHIYSNSVNEEFDRFNSINHCVVNKDLVRDRDVFNQRSYIDIKLRLSNHLLINHCDKLTFANGVEGRYPFLDKEIIEAIRVVPAQVKHKKEIDKYFLRLIAEKHLPKSVISRGKFEASNDIRLKELIKLDWLNNLLSTEKVKQHGFFKPDTVNNLKNRVLANDFNSGNLYEDNLLLTIISFNIFMDLFKMESF